MQTSTMLNENAINCVNDLVSANIDSAKGFRTAAEVVDDAVLRMRFEQYAAQRDQNAEELRRFIAGSGATPEDSGSVSGTAHRWWMDLRSKVAGGDSSVVLSEAERAEDSIKNSYEEALKDVSTTPVKDVLQRQYVEVKRGHDTIRDLRDAAKRG